MTTVFQVIREHPGAVIMLLVLIGTIVAMAAPAEVMALMAHGERLAAHPATLTMLIVIQALLFTFSLPGSVMVWVVAPFMHPVKATLVLIIGSIIGCLGAYWFAHRLGTSTRDSLEEKAAYRILRRHSDAFTQCALRLLPGFPHSVVNYAAGTLALPLTGFTLAIVVGLGLKWALYSSVIYALVEAGEGELQLGFWQLSPLLGLAVLLILGRFAANRIKSNNR
jgi:uncharacterized membrane protein YdjX (TVP38/TMEM64 family)